MFVILTHCTPLHRFVSVDLNSVEFTTIEVKQTQVSERVTL